MYIAYFIIANRNATVHWALFRFSILKSDGIQEKRIAEMEIAVSTIFYDIGISSFVILYKISFYLQKQLKFIALNVIFLYQIANIKFNNNKLSL